MNKWVKKSSKIVLDDKFMQIKKDEVELPNGDIIPWTYWDSNDSAMVIAMDKNRKLIMIRQYKYLVQDHVLEFPSGGLDASEDPEVGAKREFTEETGYRCEGLVKLGSFYEIYSQLNRQIHIFFGNNAEFFEKSLDKGEEGYEDIEVKLVDFEKAVALAKEDKIVAMGSALAILLLNEKVNKKEIDLSL